MVNKILKRKNLFQDCNFRPFLTIKYANAIIIRILGLFFVFLLVIRYSAQKIKRCL
jgi:hypothetical protein